MASILFFLWALSFYFYISEVIIETELHKEILPVWIHPLILYGVVFIWMALPIRPFFGEQRIWIWEVLLKIAVAPFKRVKFKDLFVADQLTSMGDFLFNIQYVFCFVNPSGLLSTGILL